MRPVGTLAGILSLIAFPSFGEPPRYSCLPTCSSTDARFLSIAESHLSTLLDSDLAIMLSVPGDATELRFDIFDGDTRGQWDSIDGSVNVTYSLYAEPQANGNGTELVQEWTDASFADDDWTSLRVSTSATARGKNGNYFYRLLVTARSEELGWTNFKVRLENGSLFLLPESFSFAAALFHWDDVFTVYPAYPELTPTTYDGTWDFYLAAANPLSRLDTWDGDMDFGSADCRDQDTDDPNTSENQIPPWADGAIHEGVAPGEQRSCGFTTGAPSDDNDFAPYLRSPSVTYSITTPDNETFVNDNPSGNCEWELFALDIDPDGGGDKTVTRLPAGMYRIRMEGVDLANLAMWRMSLPLLGVDPEGRPVPLLSAWQEAGVPGRRPRE